MIKNVTIDFYIKDIDLMITRYWPVVPRIKEEVSLDQYQVIIDQVYWGSLVDGNGKSINDACCAGIECHIKGD